MLLLKHVRGFRLLVLSQQQMLSFKQVVGSMASSEREFG